MHIFNSAFLLINILNDDSNFSVPSKVLSYIVAAKPIFLVMPEDNEISQMVIKNNLGVVVNHKDNEILLKKLNQLLKDQELRNIFSNNCKKYSKDNFLSENKMNEFLTLYDILLS